MQAVEPGDLLLPSCCTDSALHATGRGSHTPSPAALVGLLQASCLDQFASCKINGNPTGTGINLALGSTPNPGVRPEPQFKTPYGHNAVTTVTPPRLDTSLGVCVYVFQWMDEALSMFLSFRSLATVTSAPHNENCFLYVFVFVWR